MGFSFKQFHIDDDKCGMPVSTDGVLLGAWAPLNPAQHILDIGAGSGLLTLMAAQRTQTNSNPQSLITAIEIDDDACIDCQTNTNASPWCDRINLLKGDIRQLLESEQKDNPQQSLIGRFDHIICNPPYFETGPKSSQNARAQARHTQSLSFAQLQSCISQLLSPQGLASLILPIVEAKRFILLLDNHGLTLLHNTKVSTVEGKAPSRNLLLIGHNTPIVQNITPPLANSLSIRNKQGHYTQQMIELTRDFYLKI